MPTQNQINQKGKTELEQMLANEIFGVEGGGCKKCAADAMKAQKSENIVNVKTDDNETAQNNDAQKQALPDNAEQAEKAGEKLTFSKNQLKFNAENARLGFIYSEVLGKPLSKRRR